MASAHVHPAISSWVVISEMNAQNALARVRPLCNPNDEHLDLAIELVCCSVQFCWAVEFFELVDEQLCNAERFRKECTKLLQLEKQSKGQGKKAPAARLRWERQSQTRLNAVQLHLYLLKQPDYVAAYLQMQIKKRRYPYLGWDELL